MDEMSAVPSGMPAAGEEKGHSSTVLYDEFNITHGQHEEFNKKLIELHATWAVADAERTLFMQAREEKKGKPPKELTKKEREVDYGSFQAHKHTPDYLTFTRFFVARDLDMDKAARLYLCWVRASIKYHIYSITEAEVMRSISSNKSWQIGFDKEGRATGYCAGGLHDKQIPLEETKFFIFHQLMRLCGNLKPEQHQFAIIVDVSGFGWKNFDVPATKAMLGILDQYFPERLGKLYIVNAGYVFCGFWKLISPFIPKRTQKKIFLHSGKAMEQLLANWDVDQLVTMVGGTNEYVYDYEHILQTRGPERKPDADEGDETELAQTQTQTQESKKGQAASQETPEE
jgi:hypothetical protein